MGDMADDMNALKAYHKEKREARAVVNIGKLKQMGIPAREQSKNVFRIDTQYGAVMYYPSSAKWQHRGKVHWGDVDSFKGWLINQGYLS